MKKFKVINSSIANSFLIDKHYSGRKPQIKYAFGLYEDDVLVAVCTYGVPASRSLCIGAMGEEYFDKIIELNRLCRVDNCKTTMSEFVGWTLREIKKYNLLIVSYADSGMNHFGAIYQACNFIYTGANKERTDKYMPGNKHSRHYTEEYSHLRKVRTSKHRYIYFACDKRHKKLYMSKLKYPQLDFPKGDKKNYKLGTVMKQKILNLKTGESYFE